MQNGPGLKISATAVSELNRQAAFTGTPGVFVSLKDTIKGFQGLVDGYFDDIPEAAFYMVGTIEEAIEKSKKMKK